MPASIPAFVNAPLLIWAREDAGFSLEKAAEESGFAPERLAAWESGGAQPTLRQAEKLAKLYGRPFSVFSLPEPPRLPPAASEYRRLPGVPPGKEPPALRLAVRRLTRRRHLALHLFAELGDEPPQFSLRARLAENPEDVGRRLRAALALPVETQLAWENEFVAFRVWRAAVERLGVLVCQFRGGELPAVRGTAIVHFPLPVAAVSSTELALSKPFTLLHEVVHLALAASDEERAAIEETRNEREWKEVERFCEAATGAALMPAEAMETDADVAAQRRDRAWEVEPMRRTAKRFRVTPTAAATRLLRLGWMTPGAYARWKQSWQTYRETHPERAGFGLATPAEKAVTRNGPLFTSLVLGALSGDRITSADACEFLDVGYSHVETLRQEWTTQPARLAVAMGN